MREQDQTRSYWRFINSGLQNGQHNMAVDEAMARAISEQNQNYPTLRVYGWNPPAISLGYHQSIDEINIDLCRQDGVDVVVRPTGGRAVLHADELTYAVVIPPNCHHYSRDIMTVYEKISLGIVAALNDLNIPVLFERSKRTPKNFARGELSSLCYASSIQHEIGYQGKKLVGSAQRRLGDIILQHGSILIGRKHLDIIKYLAKGDEKWRLAVQRYMESHTICLNDLNPFPLSFEQLAKAMRKGFEKALNIDFTESNLSPEENALVDTMEGNSAKEALLPD